MAVHASPNVCMCVSTSVIGHPGQCSPTPALTAQCSVLCRSIVIIIIADIISVSIAVVDRNHSCILLFLHLIPGVIVALVRDSFVAVAVTVVFVRILTLKSPSPVVSLKRSCFPRSASALASLRDIVGSSRHSIARQSGPGRSSQSPGRERARQAAKSIACLEPA